MPQLGAGSALRWSAFACFSAGALLWLGPWILRPDLISDDAAHHVFWLYRYADPTLFPGDLSVEYFSSHSVAPIGYRTLYAALAPWADVLAVAEWLSILLLAMSAVMAWSIGRAIQTPDPDLVGLLAVATLMLLLPFVDLHPAMAFQRTFALPATLLCVWALVTGRYRWVGVSWVVAALFYPVIVPVLGLSAGLVFLSGLAVERQMPKYWVWNGLLGSAALLIVVLGSGTPEAVGPMVTYEQARLMPEFGIGGRQQLFGSGLTSYWLGHHRTGLGWRPWTLLALGVALVVIWWRGSLKLLPKAVWVVGLTGVVLWFVARLVLFDLYLPNRHSRWSLVAFAIVVFSLGAYSLIAWIARGHRPDQMVGVAWGRFIALAMPIVVSVSLTPFAYANLSKPVDSDLERAYSFIETLPVDTLVVAHPDLANFVPVRSKRSVLASTEGAIAFMLGYYRQFRPRLEASLRAAYATSWQELDALGAEYGADVVLTAPQVWQSNQYDAGFEDLMQQLWLRGAQEGFVLEAPSPERVIFRSGEVYVVRLEPVTSRAVDGDVAR